MGRNIALFIIFVLVVIGGYYYYEHYVRPDQADNGAVRCVAGCSTPEEQARFKKENSGDTADGNSEHKKMTARQDDATGFQDGAVAAGQAPATGTTGTAPVAAAPVPANPGGVTNQPPATAAVAQPTTAPSAGYESYGPATPVGMPTTDSQSANAPNDLHFRGSGNYQWYRQGNLTWRIDTVSGRSCIIFATMEEWRKQIVYSHGCGRSA